MVREKIIFFSLRVRDSKESRLRSSREVLKDLYFYEVRGKGGQLSNPVLIMSSVKVSVHTSKLRKFKIIKFIYEDQPVCQVQRKQI